MAALGLVIQSAPAAKRARPTPPKVAETATTPLAASMRLTVPSPSLTTYAAPSPKVFRAEMVMQAA